MVLNRAKELVVDLSDADISQKAKDIAQYSKKLDKMNDKYRKVNDLEVKQMSLFDTVKDDDIVTDIMNLDISNMTPIDALNTLYKLQGKAMNRLLNKDSKSSALARAFVFCFTKQGGLYVNNTFRPEYD